MTVAKIKYVALYQKKFISAINNRYVKLLLMKRVLGILMEMILIFSHIFFNATQLSQDVVTFEIATTFTLFFAVK